MLFGRRKPGFTEVVPVDEQGEELIDSTQSSEKPELMSYLDSLPEVEDGFSDIEVEEEVEEVELTEAQKLAGYIRTRTAATTLTSLSLLQEEVENFEELLNEIKEDETCSDILCVQGSKDVYYYSSLYMSNNYAMIASLVEEKDLARTIATMVRFNCKTYPAPTPIDYFEKQPYFSTIPQIDRALSLMKDKEEYQDIKEFINNKNVRHFYSSDGLSDRYAKSLAEVAEFTD